MRQASPSAQRAPNGALCLSADVSRRQQTSADISIRQHTSYFAASEAKCSASARWCVLPVSIRQHTSAYVRARQDTSGYVRIRQHTLGYVKWAVSARWCALPRSTCGFGVSVTSAPSSCHLPVSIRQHMSAYVSIRAWKHVRLWLERHQRAFLLPIHRNRTAHRDVARHAPARRYNLLSNILALMY